MIVVELTYHGLIGGTKKLAVSLYWIQLNGILNIERITS
jgi:hypothetical protein